MLHLDHRESPAILPQRCLDTALDCWEIKRIPVIDAVGIAYGNANLADAAQSLLNQSFVPLVERLVAAQEERRWRLRNKLVQELFTNLLPQKVGVPSRSTLTSKCDGTSNMSLVSANRLVLNRSAHITKASPNAARVASVGQTKSAIA